ncbi:MAG: DUF433 domain-containing protein [Caldilineaceae bacterium]
MSLVLDLPHQLEKELSGEANKVGLSLNDYALSLLSLSKDTQSPNTMILQRPGFRGGRPYIAGTGTTVRTIASLYKLGLSPEEIAGELPLNMAQIYAALTYYHLHQAEIDEDIELDSEANLIKANKNLPRG